MKTIDDLSDQELIFLALLREAPPGLRNQLQKMTLVVRNIEPGQGRQALLRKIGLPEIAEVLGTTGAEL